MSWEIKKRSHSMIACVHIVNKASSKRREEASEGGSMGTQIIEAHSDSNRSILDSSSSIDSNTSSNNTKRVSMRSHHKGRKEGGILTIGLKMGESFILSMVGIKIF